MAGGREAPLRPTDRREGIPEHDKKVHGKEEEGGKKEGRGVAGGGEAGREKLILVCQTRL